MKGRKKKPRAPSAVKLVKTMARARIGRVPPETAVPDQRRKPAKHRPSLAEQLRDAD
ncbi:MAG TPA: hypothetical protein VFP94_06985 [Terriglobales bacterium]|nr:hypothetical protein [Terriglobales bacterium]